MKIFYGDTLIKDKELKEAGIRNRIKLEYYKIINDDERLKRNKTRYGLSVVKKEYLKTRTEIEEKTIKYLSNDERIIERLLGIFKDNEVTPIAVTDVIIDTFNKFILI